MLLQTDRLTVFDHFLKGHNFIPEKEALSINILAHSTDEFENENYLPIMNCEDVKLHNF